MRMTELASRYHSTLHSLLSTLYCNEDATSGETAFRPVIATHHSKSILVLAQSSPKMIDRLIQLVQLMLSEGAALKGRGRC